jgi:hypothetical protein
VDGQKSEVAEEEAVSERIFADLGVGLTAELDLFCTAPGTVWGQFGTRYAFMKRSNRLYNKWAGEVFFWMQCKRSYFTTVYTKRGKAKMKSIWNDLPDHILPFDKWRKEQARTGSDYQINGPAEFTYSASLKTGSPSGGALTREHFGTGWVEPAQTRWTEFLRRSDFNDRKFRRLNPDFIEIPAAPEGVTLEESGLATADLLIEPKPDGQANDPADAVVKLTEEEDHTACDHTEGEGSDEDDDGSGDSSDEVVSGGEDYMEIEITEVAQSVQQILMTNTKLYESEVGSGYKVDDSEFIKETYSHERWEHNKSVHHQTHKISEMLFEFLPIQKDVKAIYFSGDKKQSLDCQEPCNFGETGPCRSTSGVIEWNNAHQSYGVIGCQLGSCSAMRSDHLHADPVRSQLRQHHDHQHAVINPSFGGLQACGWCYYTSASPLTLFLHLAQHVCQTALRTPTIINAACHEVCGQLIDGEVCGAQVGDFYLAHVENVHMPKRGMICLGCDAELLTPIHLTLHSRSVTGWLNFTHFPSCRYFCLQCGESANPKLAELRRLGKWLQPHSVLDFAYSGVLKDPKEIEAADGKPEKDRRFEGDLVYQIDPTPRGLDSTSATAVLRLDLLHALQASSLSTPGGWPSLRNVPNYLALLRAINIPLDINNTIFHLHNAVTLKYTAEGDIEDFIVSNMLLLRFSILIIIVM